MGLNEDRGLERGSDLSHATLKPTQPTRTYMPIGLVEDVAERPATHSTFMAGEESQIFDSGRQSPQTWEVYRL